jgi:hypothetical protein
MPEEWRFLFTKISDGANIGHESESGRLRWRKSQKAKNSGDFARA